MPQTKRRPPTGDRRRFEDIALRKSEDLEDNNTQSKKQDAHRPRRKRACGQRVLPGDIVRDNNDIPALFRGIADARVELSELSDPHFEESPAGRVSIGEFLDKFTSENESLEPRPGGIICDHPSHGEEFQGKSVVDRGSNEIETRWAKETIGLAAVELNEAYANLDTTRDNVSIPSGTLYQASRRLEEAMQRLGLTNEIPF